MTDAPMTPEIKALVQLRNEVQESNLRYLTKATIITVIDQLASGKHVIVPVEPTVRMLMEAGPGPHEYYVKNMWSAMLSAVEKKEAQNERVPWINTGPW